MNMHLPNRRIGPAVYCGRFPDDLCHDLVLDDRQVVTSRSVRTLADCSALIILDAMSFPWEMLKRIVQDLPFYLVLPNGMAFEDVRAVLAGALNAVTFYDRVIVADGTIGSALAEEYRWARCQWQIHDDAVPAIAKSLLADLRARESISMGAGTAAADGEDPYREGRNARLALPAPERAACSVRPSLRDGKHMHARQCAAFASALRATMQRSPGWVALEIGCGVGRWVSEFERHGAEYIGLDQSADAVGVCQGNHPATSVLVADARTSLPIRNNSVDLVALIAVLDQLSEGEKRSAIQNAWRVVRPGGQMLLLESFVGSGVGGLPMEPISWQAMQAMLVEESCNTALLEHFETVAYRHMVGVKAALAVLSKLGEPLS